MNKIISTNTKIFLLFLLFLTTALIGQDKNSGEVLITGPFAISAPANILNSFNAGYAASLTDFEEIDLAQITPYENGNFANSGKNWKLSFLPVTSFEIPSSGFNIYYLAVYVESSQYCSPSLEINSSVPFKAALNGKKISSSTIYHSENDSSEIKEIKASLTLETGKHTIIFKLLIPSDISSPVFNFSLNTQDVPENAAYLTINPVRYASFAKLLDDTKISGISVSPGGVTGAVFMSQWNTAVSKSQRWIDFYDIPSGKKKLTLKGGFTYSNFQWKDSNSFTYIESNGGKSDLYHSNLTTGENSLLVSQIKNLSSYRWSSKGDAIFYSVYESAEEFKDGLKRHLAIEDRWGGWRYKYKLMRYDLSTGIHSLVLDFDGSPSISDISQDGNQLLFSVSGLDTTRPFSYSVLYKLDLATNRVDSLFKLYYAGSYGFTKDGKGIIFTGGPSLFDGIGKTTPEGVIPNDYNNQIFLYNIESKEIRALSKNFNPRIDSYDLTPLNDDIIVKTTDRSGYSLYKLNIKSNKFTKIELPVIGLQSFSSGESNSGLFYGSNPQYPDVLYKIDLTSGKSTKLFDPNSESFKFVKESGFEKFEFEHKGKKIDGSIYYPPNFDPTKKYPLIVHYYGGVSPVSDVYEGRYPKNIWTANGYVVYIPQPSGAYGYGQEYSATHVNDWGTIAGEEIIAGTEALLNSKSFLDRQRVGCIGASYGGFMSMSLITKTDMFAAAISHAGISHLSSYWGEGNWGAIYSAVATAESYPWNRSDIYEGKSPLNFADKVNTPLLLLHGNEDNNVPPGESLQFYTALKLLGKDVEYIEVDKQNHHIMERDKRLLWSKTIIAYFDKYLKSQPAWWESIWGR
ncbi:MAG: S9 family peptidase [Ignavibacteriaceae bacterium]|nr:S9 family peptidase [Ignavibacteriaceae bacterium]